MSKKRRIIMQLLKMHGRAYGLDLVKASDGTLRRGVIYITLSGMEDEGLIVRHDDGERPMFELSEHGRAEYERLGL